MPTLGLLFWFGAVLQGEGWARVGGRQEREGGGQGTWGHKAGRGGPAPG